MHKSSGRPIPGYSYNNAGKKISDYQIKEWLCDSICGDGFPYGYKKLTVCLREEHNLTINSKKVYRLCHELDILRPQRVISQRHPRHLARRENVSAPNELWEMDIKYGYIYGQDKFFFQLTIIDVFDRTAVDYIIYDFPVLLKVPVMYLKTVLKSADFQKLKIYLKLGQITVRSLYHTSLKNYVMH
jgi:putative transposase